MNNLLINIYTSGTDIVARLQKVLDAEQGNYDTLIVNLYEPGIIYYKNKNLQTFVDLIEENKSKDNICFYGCNFANRTGLPLKFINNMFHEGPDLYQKDGMCKDLLSRCVTVDKKSNDLKKFDFLMGGTTVLKDRLYDELRQHPVNAQVYTTYYRDDPKKGKWSAYVKVPVKHTAETIYDKRKSTLRYSDLIDPEIYNSTFYTALIETMCDPDFGVFTEKTAKPIVSQRPFVAFASPGYLQALRNLGFKTFSTVIDESYDREKDTQKRFKMVLDAMLGLCSQDPKSVYEKLRDTLQHNKRHFENTDWNRDFQQVTMKSKKVDLFRFEQ